MSLQKKMI